MTHVNVLIIEDNLTATSILEVIIRKMGCYVLATVDNSDEALSCIYHILPNLVFMNIDIKGKCSGTELAMKIRALHIPIIYIPVFDTKEERYEHLPDMLVPAFGKPNDKLTLYASIALGFYTLRGPVGYQYNETGTVSDYNESGCRLTDSVFIKKGDAFCKVCFKDILYIKADGNYCEIQTADEKFIHKITLTKLINSLPRQHFLKVHRSYVVYIHHVRKFSLSRNKLIVGRFTIPVGKGYKTTLMNCLRKI